MSSSLFVQQSWKQEVWEYNERMKGEDVAVPMMSGPGNDNALIRRRKEELKHAQDVKVRKLKKTFCQETFSEKRFVRLSMKNVLPNLQLITFYV